MSRKKSKELDESKFSKPGIRVKIFVNEDMIGEGKVTLLKYLGETGSISGAAKKMGLGYRRAWFLLDTVQRCFDEPLFTTSRGGASAGGTTLTEFGEEFIARYTASNDQTKQASADLLAWLETKQKLGA